MPVLGPDGAPIPPDRIVDVIPGTAPSIKLAPGELLRVGDVGLRFHEPGPFIVLPLERWVATLNRAVGNEMAKEDAVAERVTRQVRRQLRRDAKN